MNGRHFSTWLSCFFLSATSAIAQEPGTKAPEVPVARPVIREITDYETFSGRTEAVNRVDLRCRVSGYLLKAPFVEGADVKRDDLLFEIDPRPYRAEMDRAEAALALAEARLKLAAANLNRAAALQVRGAMSREDFDKIAGEKIEAEVAIRGARAGRDAARLNLDFTRVVAPIDGRIGRRLIDPGNLVKADDTHLAVIVSRDPMYVYFDIDERTLLGVLRSQGDDRKSKTFLIDIALADEKEFPRRGVVNFIDNRLDPSGTLRMRAVLANKDGILSPGMFVRVRVTVGMPHKALLIPGRAVMVEDGERFVFVVNDKNKVETRPVSLGKEYDGLRVVETGLTAEDRVIIGGLGRIGPGMTVRPRLEALPEKQPAADDSRPSASTSPRGSFGPGILVEAVYPGASAAVTSDSVRAPIEQMVGGLEKLRYLRSRCTNDGKLTIALAFARGVDLQRAQVLTQNRVNLALPLLPDAVTKGGISVTFGTSGVLMVVNLLSPDNKLDRRFLGNYANVQIRDELARLAGVGEVKLIGHSDYALRVWLDPAKLAERGLSPGAISRLIAKEKGSGTPWKLENLIVKVDGEGRIIRLKEVGRVELGAGAAQGEVYVDDKPAVALVIYGNGEVATPKLRDTLQRRLAQLRRRLPEGLALEAIFDLTESRDAAGYLLLDLDLPVTAAAGRIENVLSRCDQLLRRVPGVEHVLGLSENPFDLFGSGPCMLVRLSPAEQNKREKVIESIRKHLAALDDATVRIRDLSQPGRSASFPIDLALDGPEAARVRAWVNDVGNRLGRSKKLSDLWVNRDARPQAQRFVDIDRDKAATLGVSVRDVMDTLDIYLGTQHAGNFNAFGRNWRVEVQADAGPGDRTKDLRQLKIRNSKGQMIPLGAFVTVRATSGPLVLHFLDGRPMMEITANPATGVSIEQARKLCETLAEQARKDVGLGAAYRLTWLP